MSQAEGKLSPMLSLDLTLKLAACTMLIVVGVHFVADDKILIAPAIAANLLFLLSVYVEQQPRRIALVAIALACIISLQTVRAYFAGSEALATVIAYLIAFFLVIYAASLRLRHN